MKYILSLTIFFLVCNWLWDVSSNAMHGWLTNGFWWCRGMAVNHLLWYLGVAAFFLLAFYAVQLKKKIYVLEAAGK